MEDFIKDRNEAFASMDEKKIRVYCEKYKIEIPDEEDIFWAGVHKAVCELFLVEDSPISIYQYNDSFSWLVNHGYDPRFKDGGEE